MLRKVSVLSFHCSWIVLLFVCLLFCTANTQVCVLVVLRHMQRYFIYICGGTDVQADWRRSSTYGRAPNAIV